MPKRCPVIEYVAEEVWRQGHDIGALDGIKRTGWMLDAWALALTFPSGLAITIEAVVQLGKLIERKKNRRGFRRVLVSVGGSVRIPALEIQPKLTRLLARQCDTKPLEFYREFEEIHPFVDGNGRTGKILLNWMNGTLLEPVFPPNDFWGEPIRNP